VIRWPGHQLFTDNEKNNGSNSSLNRGDISDFQSDAMTSGASLVRYKASPSESSDRRQSVGEFFVDDEFTGMMFADEYNGLAVKEYVDCCQQQQQQLQIGDHWNDGSGLKSDLIDQICSTKQQFYNSGTPCANSVSDSPPVGRHSCNINANHHNQFHAALSNCGNHTNVINNNVNINMKLNLPGVNPDSVFNLIPPTAWNLWTRGLAATGHSLVGGAGAPRDCDALDVFSQGENSSREVAVRWEVKNIGERRNLFQYMEKDLLGHSCSVQATRQVRRFL